MWSIFKNESRYRGKAEVFNIVGENFCHSCALLRTTALFPAASLLNICVSKIELTKMACSRAQERIGQIFASLFQRLVSVQLKKWRALSWDTRAMKQVR